MSTASLKHRWEDTDARLKVAGPVALLVALYTLLYNLPGSNDWLHEKAPFGVIVLGIVYGTVTALGAMGLVLIYRANRFINFAFGALGSLVGVLAIGFVIEKGVSYWVALPVGVAVGVLVGIVTELVVIRRFQNASRLVLTVASIGLAQLYGAFELVGAKRIGFLSLTGGFAAPLDIEVKIAPIVLHGDEMLIVIVAPLVILGLAWFLLKTDAGVAVRASAENVERALLLGIPVRRLSTMVWGIAGGLATLTFILTAPFQGVKPGVASQGPTVLLPLLAVAVVARMESLPLAFGAGLGLGILEQVTRWNSTGSPSVIYVVYFVVIIGALLLQRGKLSRAKDGVTSSWSATGIIKPIPSELRSLPEVRWAKAGLLALVAAAFIFIPMTFGSRNQGLAGTAMVWAMVAVSLVVLTGWAGNISLGQFGIVGLGGLVAANMFEHNNDLFLTLAAAGAAGGIVALIVGLPALRIKGLFLAVTTLTFAIALDQYFLNRDNFSSLIPQSIERPMVWKRFPLQLENGNSYLVCLAFLILSILACTGVRKARSGRVLIATRDNQRAADAASVPTTGIKLSGFVLAGVIAGVAGGLYVMQLTSIGQGTFQPADSLTVFSTAVIGGLGSITGAVTGVLLFRYLETITALGDLRAGLTGFGLLVVLYVLPGGLGQLIYSVRDRYLRRVADRRGILVPSLVADKRADDDKPADEVDLLKGALTDDPASPDSDRIPVGVAR